MPTRVPAGLDPAPTTLANGARGVAVRTTLTPAVTINIALEAGSMYDPAPRPGVAFLLSRVIERGTAARSADEIAEDLDLRGVSLRVAVTRQVLSVSCDCLVEDFEVILPLLADIIRHPACPEPEIETRRGEVLTAIRQDEDNPAVTSLEGLMELLYGGDHPFGRLTKGTATSAAAIGREDLLAFHRSRFFPEGLSVVVVGDLEPEAALEAVTGAFDDWQAEASPPVALEPPPRATGRRRVIVPMMNKSQADIAYGFTTITRDDPAYYAYWLMANVLGQFGMGGRLGQSIRERQGMAYYAFCGFEAGRIPGPLIVRAGVNASNVDRAIASVDAEVTALASDGVTADELANSKRYLTGSLPRTLETNAGIAAFLQNVQQFELGLDFDRRLPSLLEAVTRDAVNDAAGRTLDADRAAIVVAGPYDDTVDV